MVETRPDAGSARAVQVLWLWYVILVTALFVLDLVSLTQSQKRQAAGW